MSSSSNSIRGTGTTQYLAYAAIINYGYLEYYPASSGIQFYLGGTFTNAPGGIFNVTSTGSVDINFNTLAAALLFSNQGFFYVVLPSVTNH